MASRYTLKTKDTAPFFEAQAQQASGAAIDLTNAEKLELWILHEEGKPGEEVKLTAEVLGAPSAGNFRVKWTELQTENPATYKVELKIKWKDGTKESVPNEGYELITIEPSVDIL
jgi:hypothetical protein